MRELPPESGEWEIPPPLILLSFQYGDIKTPVSLTPGRVAESCRATVPPLLYLFLPGLSLDKMKELAISARARVVPEMADESSFSEGTEDERAVMGRRVFTGSSVPVSLGAE